MTKEDFEEFNAEHEKRLAAAEKRINQRHEELIKTLTTIRSTNPGMSGPQSFLDVLACNKGVMERPAVLSRGQTYEISIATKDILGASRLLPATVPPVVAGLGQVALGVQDMIPSSPTNAASVQFLRETAFTNAAASVAEGAAKPKSDKTFSLITEPCETIAHYFKVSRQSWEDLVQLAAQIESNGFYGVNRELDRLCLKGTGTTPEIGPGLYTGATAAASVAAGTTMIDRLFLAAAEINTAGYRANGIVMNAGDLTAMMLLKDSTGRYIYSSSVQLPGRMVTSPNLAAGEFLVGDFNQAHLYVREQTSLTIAATNEDDFIKNMLTALAETRLALAVYQPAAFRKNGAVA